MGGGDVGVGEGFVMQEQVEILSVVKLVKAVVAKLVKAVVGSWRRRWR